MAYKASSVEKFRGKNLSFIIFICFCLLQLSDCTASGSTLLVCKSPNVTDKETSFTYGLVLDGVTTYSNLSNQFSHAMVDVVNDPIVTRKEYDDYKMLFSDTITIMVSCILIEGRSSITYGVT